MFFYSRKQPTFCFTFFRLWLQFNYNLQITLNFISFSQGFSFQIGYCEVDDQLPGRSIPQYTLYLTVANEKERLDWIRALRAGELKEHWREIKKKFLKWKFLKCVICKHFIKLNKKKEFNTPCIGYLQIYYVHWKWNYHFMNIQKTSSSYRVWLLPSFPKNFH